jgi:Fe-S cluster biogenesis protein NfuA
MNMENIEEKIKEVIEKIRPFLQNDGGDIEFVKFENGIVYVKMHGACMDCVNLDNTISDGIEMILIDEVSGVIGVEVVKD